MSNPEARQEIGKLLLGAAQCGASDLHVVTGYPPTYRIHGQLQNASDRMLDGPTVREMLFALCPKERLSQFVSDLDVDFSLELDREGVAYRFRANYFHCNQQPSACFRVIPSKIPSFEWAGFPVGLAERIRAFLNGLVIVTGVAGSGKTTTLAMIINLMTGRGGYRVITIEDPVEYVFEGQDGSIVTQREVGRDVRSFGDGLKYGLRQDPDVILVGEIRDRETARLALSAAETGHLVLSTMHTRDAKGAITRLTDLFPTQAQNEIRTQLALSLRAVISQHLLSSATVGAKRELALEVLFNNLGVSSAIRLGRVESIDNCILSGKSEGMVTLDDSVRTLLRSARIGPEVAKRYSSNVP